ncbi:MAG: hypothetical protein K0U64_07320 [Actinomycetia bacterium]|nr:hypothetical protein [Actinomycetes bacterium]
MGAWSDSREVTKRCFSVVKANPYMMAFPVIGAVAAVVAMLAIVGVGLAVMGLDTVTTEVEKAAQGGDVATLTYVEALIILALAGYAAVLVTQVCMGALVSAADMELRGEDSSIGAGFSAAFSRFGPLAGWAAIQTLVGWLLSAIRGNGSGNNAILAIVRMMVAAIAAVAWALITFFVLPLIMLRGKGPISAIKESTRLLKQTWGSRLAGGVRIGGLIFLLAVLPGIIVLIAGGLVAFLTENLGVGIPVMVIGAVVIICAQILVSTLRAVFSVALLHFAEDGSVQGPFTAAELQSAVRVKG